MVLVLMETLINSNICQVFEIIEKTQAKLKCIDGFSIYSKLKQFSFIFMGLSTLLKTSVSRHNDNRFKNLI